MATKRITELNTLTAALLTPSDDLLMIIDHSAAVSGKNKNMTVQSFLSGAGGSEPLPYKYKETFTARNTDNHLIDNRNSLFAPHIWIAPPTGQFPNTARIRCWGGGSGGGGGNNLINPGGGGGGGAYAEKLFTYTPGTQYGVIVGPGGQKGLGATNNESGTDGLSGGASLFTDLSVVTASPIPSSGTHVLAKGSIGGVGAQASSSGGTGGSGGQASGSTGDITKDGGSGADNNTNSLQGGTGGGSYRGGSGGRGGSNINAGDARDGNFPGGGGGGGNSLGGGELSTISNGGNGSHGLVTIEYNNSPADYSYNVHSP
jgi:hypothetical protein